METSTIHPSNMAPEASLYSSPCLKPILRRVQMCYMQEWSVTSRVRTPFQVRSPSAVRRWISSVDTFMQRYLQCFSLLVPVPWTSSVYTSTSSTKRHSPDEKNHLGYDPEPLPCKDRLLHSISELCTASVSSQNPAVLCGSGSDPSG